LTGHTVQEYSAVTEQFSDCFMYRAKANASSGKHTIDGRKWSNQCTFDECG